MSFEITNKSSSSEAQVRFALCHKPVEKEQIVVLILNPNTTTLTAFQKMVAMHGWIHRLTFFKGVKPHFARHGTSNTTYK